MVSRIGPKRPLRLFLREWREHFSLSQEQLAARLETSKATISRHETGDRDSDTAYLGAIAEALDIPVSYLFRDPQQPTVDELLANSTPEIRRQAFAVVQTLVKTGTDG